MMSKKPSDSSTIRTSSRDRTFSRKNPALPLDREATALVLKEKLLLLHFHDQLEPDQESIGTSQAETVIEANVVVESEADALRNRKKFERSVTAPVLPLNRPVSLIQKKRSNTLANAYLPDQQMPSPAPAPAPPNRKRSEYGTAATVTQTKHPPQRQLDSVKQAIGGCCSRLKKAAQCGTASTTTSGSIRSGSGSG